MKRGDLLFCTVYCDGTVGPKEGRVRVADSDSGRFVFLLLSVIIKQRTRQKRSFSIEAYFSNAHSIIAVHRAFRL